jgi:hypothetical protein
MGVFSRQNQRAASGARRALLAKHSPTMLLAHFVGDARS